MMTPSEFRARRLALGLSAERLARLLGVSSGRRVRAWESGQSAIPGPVAVLMQLLIDVPAVRARLLAA